MRRSEFLRAAAELVVDRADSLVHDLILGSLGRTAREALDAGVPPRDIWVALCDEADVPLTRRYGVGRLEPRER